MKKKLFLIISFFVFSNSIFFNAAQEKKSDISIITPNLYSPEIIDLESNL